MDKTGHPCHRVKSNYSVLQPGLCVSMMAADLYGGTHLHSGDSGCVLRAGSLIKMQMCGQAGRATQIVKARREETWRSRRDGRRRDGADQLLMEFWSGRGLLLLRNIQRAFLKSWLLEDLSHFFLYPSWQGTLPWLLLLLCQMLMLRYEQTFSQ